MGIQYAADRDNCVQHYPTDLAQRADVNRRLLRESSAAFPSCYAYLDQNCVKPLLGDTTDQAVIDGENECFGKLAGTLTHA